jgi:hypothetical protein
MRSIAYFDKNICHQYDEIDYYSKHYPYTYFDVVFLTELHIQELLIMTRRYCSCSSIHSSMLKVSRKGENSDEIVRYFF